MKSIWYVLVSSPGASISNPPNIRLFSSLPACILLKLKEDPVGTQNLQNLFSKTALCSRRRTLTVMSNGKPLPQNRWWNLITRAYYMNERSLARAELLILVSLAVWPRVARCGRARRVRPLDIRHSLWTVSCSPFRYRSSSNLNGRTGGRGDFQKFVSTDLDLTRFNIP